MKEKVVILGGGESGVGAAILAKDLGFEVFLSEQKSLKSTYKNQLDEEGILFEEGVHTNAIILEAKTIIKSPGIPDSAPIVQEIKSRNIELISEIEFAYRYQKGKIVGITGSNGKTTTTNLIYHIFNQAGLNVGMAGNVGNSFAYMVARAPKDIYVLEISSFQLDDIKDFKCDVAILLNITPDHLDRYQYEMKNYVFSKFKITQNLTEKDVFIYCKDDQETINFMKANSEKIIADKIPFSIMEKVDRGGYLDDEDRLILNYKEPQYEMEAQQLTIKGKHNQYNSLAAGIAAQHFNIKSEKLKACFQSFKAIPHRMETFLTLGGIEFINDSKATNVNSTWYALESLNKKAVWIIGGVDKGNDYSVLKELARQKVKAIVCLGEDTIKIHQAFTGVVDVMTSAQTMKEAVKVASKLAQKGDCVILSPCCASFDLFANYEERGNVFKQCVREL